jgi:hypothetical protein
MVEPTEPSLNYVKTNWKELKKQLQTLLPPPPENTLTTANDIDSFAQNLITTMINAILVITLRKKLCSHSKR